MTLMVEGAAAWGPCAPCAMRWSSPSASSSAATVCARRWWCWASSSSALAIPLCTALASLFIWRWVSKPRSACRQERRFGLERHRGLAGAAVGWKLGINRALWVFGVVQWLAIRFLRGWPGSVWPRPTPAALACWRRQIGLEALGGLGTTASSPIWRAPPHPALYGITPAGVEHQFDGAAPSTPWLGWLVKASLVLANFFAVRQRWRRQHAAAGQSGAVA